MAKLPLADPNYAAIQAQLAQQRAYTVTANQDTANRLGEMAQKYNWMDGQVLSALVLGGASDDTIDQAAKAAANSASQAGAPTPAPSHPPSGGGNWFTDAVGDIAGDATGLARGVVRTGTSALQSGYQAVQNTMARSFHNVGDVITDVAHGDIGSVPGDIAEQIGGNTSDLSATTAGQAVKNTIQSGDPGLGSGWMSGQAINAQQGAAARQVRGTINGEAWTLGRQFADLGSGLGVIQPGSVQYKMVSGEVDLASMLLLDPANALHLPHAATPLTALDEATEAGAAAARNAENATNAAAAGENVFAAGPAGAEATTSAAKVRSPAQYARTTVGKGILSDLADTSTPAEAAQILGPDASASLAHTVASTSDTSAITGAMSQEARTNRAWWLRVSEQTPATAAEQAAGTVATEAPADLTEAQQLERQAMSSGPLAKAAGKAAVRDPEWYKTVSGNAGLIAGPSRNTVYTPQALKWLYGSDGQNVVESLAKENSAAKITRILGNTEAGVALANASNPEEVISALGPFLTDGTMRQFPVAGHWSGNLDSVGGRVVQRLQDRYRWANTVPESTRLPINDPDTAFRNMDNALANANVLGDQRDTLMNTFAQAAVSGDKPGMYKAVVAASGAVKDSLVAHGVSEADAADMTSIVRDADRMSTWFTGDVADGVPYDMLNAAGHGPYRVGQLLDSGLYLHDPAEVKGIRELTGRLSKVLTQATTAVAGPELGSVAPELARLPKVLVEGAQDAIWKPATIFRPAYATRIVLESIAKMLQSGKFDNSFDYIAAATGHGYGSDLTGVAFEAAERSQELQGLIEAGAREGLSDGEMDALRNEFHATNDAIGKGLSDYNHALINKDGGQNLRGLATGATTDYSWKNGSWVRASRDVNPDQWHQGMLDELAAQRADPVYQRVANGGTFTNDLGHVDGQGLDGIEQWIMGPGAKQLKPIFETMGFDITNPDDVKSYVALINADVARHTGLDPDLLNVVANGRLPSTAADAEEGATAAAFGGHNGQGRLDPTDTLRQKISDFIDADNAPDDVRYQQSLSKQAASGGSRAANAADAVDRTSRFMFSKLHGVPEDMLGRSPLYRRTYWDYAAKLAPALDPDHASEVLDAAEKAGLSKSAMGDLRAGLTRAAGDANVDEIHTLASGYALDEVRRLYMSAATNNQFLDMARIALPFGQAWGSVMKSWGRVLADNPTAVYKATRAVQGLRGAVALPFGLSPGDVDGDGHRDGFFHPDPTTGQEVFNFPLSGELARMVTGVNAPLMAPVQGLSMATDVMPGLGPVAQLPLSWFVPDTPTFDDVNNLLFPYGRPTGGINSLMPSASWAAKLVDGFDKNQQSPQFARLWQQTAQYLATTDQYRGKHDAATLQALSDDAKKKAGVLLMMRGVAQAMGPSSPATRFVVDTKQGDLLTAKLIDDYANMQQEDYTTASARFLDKYGQDVWAYMAPATKSTVPGQSATDTYDVWVRDHGDVMRSYPQVAGFFAPTAGTFDMQAYERQLDTGGRKLVSTDDMLAGANSTLASMQWRADKADADKALSSVAGPNGKVPGTVTTAVQDWLRQRKQDLASNYPGFDPDAAGLMSAGARKQQIAQALTAANDPRVNQTDAGQGLVAYLQVRDQATAAAKQLKLTTFTTAKAAAPIRTWLRHQAETIIAAHPEFGRLFDQVLDGEMVQDQGS